MTSEEVSASISWFSTRARNAVAVPPNLSSSKAWKRKIFASMKIGALAS